MTAVGEMAVLAPGKRTQVCCRDRPTQVCTCQHQLPNVSTGPTAGPSDAANSTWPSVPGLAEPSSHPPPHQHTDPLLENSDRRGGSARASHCTGELRPRLWQDLSPPSQGPRQSHSAPADLQVTESLAPKDPCTYHEEMQPASHQGSTQAQEGKDQYVLSHLIELVTSGSCRASPGWLTPPPISQTEGMPLSFSPQS